MAKKPKTPRKQPARRTAAKADAAQLPVHQTLTPSAPFELKASEIERALVTGEHSQLLERYFGASGIRRYKTSRAKRPHAPFAGRHGFTSSRESWARPSARHGLFSLTT